MRRVDTAEQGPSADRSPPVEPGLTLRDLSHELNSRLDGAMRSVRLAEQSLMALAPSDAGRLDEAMARLQVAQQALRLMAGMLEDVLAGEAAAAGHQGRTCPLDEEVRRTIDSLQPLATDLGVALEVGVDPAAADVDAGPLLGIVLHNGLRNAIQACEGVESCRVELLLEVHEAQEVRIRIKDTGRGLASADGGNSLATGPRHGIGLDLSRRLVERMGGRLSLTDCPSGRGSEFRVVVPARRWTSP